MSLRLFRVTCFFLITLAAVTSMASLLRAEESEKPVIHVKEPIKLFNGKNLDGLYTFLKDTKYEDPRGVFTVKDGLLNISGDGWGGVITKDRYADYRVICEFRWGKKTWDSRTDRAKDSGLLIHCFGADDGYGGIWPSSIEANIIQGGCGDFILVCGKDPEGKPVSMSGTATVTNDRDGEPVFDPEGEKREFTAGRINNRYRDPDWEDKLGYRGKNEVERPNGEWNTLEVICDGDKITVYLNGVLVNEMTNASPSSGKLLIQTELAEIHVRRWELLPLKKK